MSQQALIVIDLQHGFFELTPKIFNGDGLLSTANILITCARQSEAPILFVQHIRPGQNVKDPELAIHPALDKQDSDTVIVKSWPDAFYETSLASELCELRIQELIVTGLQTEYCIDTSCRRACSLGFDVTLVKDGHSTWDSTNLSAEQIIEHHNRVLGDWFANVRPSNEIQFTPSNI